MTAATRMGVCVLAFSAAAFSQRVNTQSVSQFPGLTVASKTAAAQAACNPSLPCTLIFDADLAGYPQGSMPGRGGNEAWWDYSHTGQTLYNGSPVGGAGGTPSGSTNFVQVANGGAFGSDAKFQWDLTNHKLAIDLGAGSDSDVFAVKIGDQASGVNDGNSNKTIMSEALLVNDTNFPNTQYVFGYEVDGSASQTNGGLNNGGIVSFRCAVTVTTQGTYTAPCLEDEQQINLPSGFNWSNPGILTGFFSAPELFAPGGANLFKYYGIYFAGMQVTGGGTMNTFIDIYNANQTSAVNNDFIVDDCNACKSYISNSLAVGVQQGAFAMTNDVFTAYGHFGVAPFGAVAGNKPTMGTCGTSPTVTGADSAGIITVGTGTVTSCALNFKTTFANAPSCAATLSVSGITLGMASTTSVMTVTSSGSMGGDKIFYQCTDIASN